MTFTEIRTAILDYVMLQSADATSRVGRAINRHHKRVTSELGMDTTRFVTRSVDMTVGVKTVTFTNIEKIDRILDMTGTPRPPLTEVEIHELRSEEPGTGQPMRWAVQNHTASSVTVLFDTVPESAFALQADGWAKLSDLAGSDEPVFAESFHDVLTWSVIAEELLKKEKIQLAREYSNPDPENPGKAEHLLSALKFHYADSPTKETRQGGKHWHPWPGGSGGGAGTGETLGFLQAGTGAVLRTVQSKLREFISVGDFNAAGDGVADDTAEFQAALDAAAHGGAGSDDITESRSDTVWLAAGKVYRIASEVTVPARAITIQGLGHEGALIQFTTAGARILVDSCPQFNMRNVMVYGSGANGSGVANNGVVVTSSEECTFDNVTFYNFGDACLDATGSHILKLINSRMVVAPTLVRLTNTSSVFISGGNLFQLVSQANTAVIDIESTCQSVSMVGTWVEGFTNVLRLDNTIGAVSLASFSAVGCHFTSTRTNSRLVLLTSTVNGNMCRLVPATFAYSLVNQTDTTFNVLTTLTGNTDGNTALNLKFDNVVFTTTPTAAIVSGDLAAVRVIFSDIVGVADTDYLDGTGSKLGVDCGGLNSYGTTTRVNSSLAVTGGITATTTIAATGNVSGADVIASSQFFERGRATALGESVAVAHAGGNFTTNGAGGWTVEAADQSLFRYSLVGLRMKVWLTLVNTTVTAATGTELYVAIPTGFTAPFNASGPCAAADNAVGAVAYWDVAGSGSTVIRIKRADGAAWTASANQTSLFLEPEFEVTPV